MENQYFYEINKQISDIHDINPLAIKGTVYVYTDEAKTNKITEIPFCNMNLELTVSAIQPFETKEEFETKVDAIVMEKVNSPEVQAKFDEVRLLNSLGII